MPNDVGLVLKFSPTPRSYRYMRRENKGAPRLHSFRITGVRTFDVLKRAKALVITVASLNITTLEVP